MDLGTFKKVYRKEDVGCIGEKFLGLGSPEPNTWTHSICEIQFPWRLNLYLSAGIEWFSSECLVWLFWVNTDNIRIFIVNC